LSPLYMDIKSSRKTKLKKSAHFGDFLLPQRSDL